MTVLELAAAEIERVQADLVVVPLFEQERPLLHAAGRLDWRLCGRLSKVVAASQFEGQWGEALLTPGSVGVRATRVLGLGMGARAGIDAERWDAWVADALGRAVSLASQRLLLAVAESGEDLAERLAAVSTRARSGPAPEEIVLVAEEVDTPVAIQWFRSMARRAQREGLEIRPPAEDGPVREGARADPAPGSQRSSRAVAGRSTR